MKDIYIKIFNSVEPSDVFKQQIINKLIARKNAGTKSENSNVVSSMSNKLKISAFASKQEKEKTTDERKMERKNIWKKITALAAAFVIVVALAITLPLVLKNNDVSGTQGLKYNAIYENGEIVAYSVSKGSANTNGTIKIADTYNGKPITTIEKDGFKDTNITKVILPSTLKYIGKSAFESCDNLVEINIVNGLESIGQFAFKKCTALTTITIPQSVVEIEAYAFSNNLSLIITVQGYTEKPTSWNNDWNKNQNSGGVVDVVWDNQPNTKIEYTITISSQIMNGIVTSDKTKAEQGTTIALTVIPNAGYQLKTGSLKSNTTDIIATTFIMPGENVIIYAEFESITLPTFSIFAMNNVSLIDNSLLKSWTTRFELSDSIIEFCETGVLKMCYIGLKEGDTLFNPWSCAYYTVELNYSIEGNLIVTNFAHDNATVEMFINGDIITFKYSYNSELIYIAEFGKGAFILRSDYVLTDVEWLDNDLIPNYNLSLINFSDYTMTINQLTQSWVYNGGGEIQFAFIEFTGNLIDGFSSGVGNAVSSYEITTPAGTPATAIYVSGSTSTPSELGVIFSIDRINQTLTFTYSLTTDHPLQAIAIYKATFTKIT